MGGAGAHRARAARGHNALWGIRVVFDLGIRSWSSGFGFF